MDIENIRQYCLQKLHTTEEFPFDDVTLVFKVAGKMFACLPLNKPEKLVLKCNADYAVELRDKYSAIEPAWHFNKRHWNAITLNGDLAASFIYRQIYNSYILVINKNVTPRALRLEITAAVKEYEANNTDVAVCDNDL